MIGGEVSCWRVCFERGLPRLVSSLTANAAVCYGDEAGLAKIKVITEGVLVAALIRRIYITIKIDQLNSCAIELPTE